ncbi:histone-lysine N-methyltransferase SETMAR [Trichonephila clavipes]|uniref:Histone-lysine N-methyltransferase SETMAR n=1 Tax=Trichonephila clavipes TaxID=2585209 RepID=A0A8X6W8F0_TRICX|nr:histone-lysine N-methyltransferase SETMAR [Trichonephila clavipes]
MTLLRAQVEANPCQTIEELSNALNQPWSTIQEHLQQIGKTNRAGVWVPHNLSEENRAYRSTTCNLLLQRTAKPDLHPKKALLCIWWGIRGVVHFEVLKRGETVNAELYCEQLDRRNQSLIEKYPAIINRKDVILQHDNARPHCARKTLEKTNGLGAVLLHASVEIQCLFAEYRIDGLRTVVQNPVLDLNGLLSLAAEKTGMLPARSRTFGTFSLVLLDCFSNYQRQTEKSFEVDKSRFCLQHQDGRIHVWWHRGERTLAACIRHRHIGQSRDVMVWDVVGYTSRLPLVRTDGTLSSAHYISGMLRLVALPFIRAPQNPVFQQDNERSHVAGTVQTSFDTENVWLLAWPARTPDLSTIENVWSMDTERLLRHHTPVTTIDELWHRVEAAWASVPVRVIQSLA